MSHERRVDIEGRPRRAEVVIEHPFFGRAVIGDNTPLSERALTNRLDDGLRPSNWLKMLNEDAHRSDYPDAGAAPGAQPAGGRTGRRVDSTPNGFGVVSMTCVQKTVKFGLRLGVCGNAVLSSSLVARLAGLSQLA